MNYQPVVACRLAEIHRMRRHNKRVRNRNYLILRRTDTRYQRCLLNHISRCIIQLNTVTQLKRTHIRDNQSCNNIPDHRTRSQRNNQSDKDWYSLKDPRFGARQVGINHSNHKCIKQEAHNVERRHSPVGIKAAYLQPFRLYFTGKITNQSHQILHGKPYHKNGKQVGNILHYTQENALYRLPDIREQLISKIFGLREYSKE